MTSASAPRPILVRQARVIDPARQLDFVGDILLDGGKIAAADSGPSKAVLTAAS